jgi:hypothetical protein
MAVAAVPRPMRTHHTQARPAGSPGHHVGDRGQGMAMIIERLS